MGVSQWMGEILCGALLGNEIQPLAGLDEIRQGRTISCCARRYPRCAWTLTSGIIGFLGKVRGGDAGIEAAGGEPEHGGGEDEKAQSSHNAAILPRVLRIGKGLE